MPQRERHAQSAPQEATDPSINLRARERSAQATEQLHAAEKTPQETLHAALAERAKSYTPGMTVERIGRLGSPERWQISSVDARGNVYLLEQTDNNNDTTPRRHAMLHGAEVAREERAATFGPTLAEAWTTVFDAKMLTLSDATAERTARVIGNNRADVLFAAAERMAANPDADPSAELLRSMENVVREVEEHARAGSRVIPLNGDTLIDPPDARLYDREKRRIITLAEDESLLAHLRFGNLAETTDEPPDAPWHVGTDATTDAGDMKNTAMLRAEQADFGLPSDNIARARARVAEALVGAPELRAEILGGFIEVDLAHPRTVETIDADLHVIEGDISTLERAWKLHGKGDKNLPEVAVHFARIHGLRQYEKSLFAERRAAVEQDAKRTQDLALADVKNLWAETLVAIDKQQKKDQSIAQLFRRDLALGADPKSIVGALEHLLSSDEFHALPPSERRGCMTLLRSLNKQYFRELTPERNEAPSTAPITGEIEIDDDAHEPIPMSDGIDDDVHEPIPMSDGEDTPETPVAPPAKTRRGRRAAHGPRIVATPPVTEPVPQKARQRIEDRLAVALAKRAQSTLENNYTEPLRKFADAFGGPGEFSRLHAEARAKTTDVRFTLEDLRNANMFTRWLYKRQMQRAVKELRQQEAEREAAAEELKKARKRRGPLMS